MWMLWVGGWHHDCGCYGWVGIMIGVCMVGWGRIAGGMSLYTVVNGRIAGGMTVYGRVWEAIACPRPSKIGQIRGYSHAQTPKIGQNRGFWGVPGAGPRPWGQAPQARGPKFGQNRWVFNNSPIRDRNCTLSTMVSRKRVPRGPNFGRFLGPRIPPDSPRVPPGPKSPKSRVFRGSAKIEGFGGMPYTVYSYIGVCCGGWDYDGVCCGGWDHDGGCYGGYIQWMDVV